MTIACRLIGDKLVETMGIVGRMALGSIVFRGRKLSQCPSKFL